MFYYKVYHNYQVPYLHSEKNKFIKKKSKFNLLYISKTLAL